MMKPLKAAAVVAGAVAIAGAAAPAFASDLTPTNLNGAPGTVAGKSLLASQPLNTDLLGTGRADSPLKSLQGATGNLNAAGKGSPTELLGGLPLGK